MDIADFFDTFFEEAEDLLADMEQHLLELDVDDPDSEQLNAIFRRSPLYQRWRRNLRF